MTEEHAPGPYVVMGQGDVRPIPDPTALSIRAIDSVREELRRELAAAKEIIEARLDAYDKAVILLQTVHDRLPQQMQELASQNIALVRQRFETQDAKLAATDGRITAMEHQRQQDHITSKEAVTAAFQAAKDVGEVQTRAASEAIMKSELATEKRIDETSRMMHAASAALDARITVLTDASKNIMTRQEVEQLVRALAEKIDGPTGIAMRFEGLVSRTSGRDEQANRNVVNNQWMVGAILGAMGMVLAIIAFLRAQY